MNTALTASLEGQYSVTIPVVGTPDGVLSFELRVSRTGTGRLTALVTQPADERPPATDDEEARRRAASSATITTHSEAVMTWLRKHFSGEAFNMIEHYNAASYGLSLGEPSFSFVCHEWDGAADTERRLRSFPISEADLCSMTGLSVEELRRL